MKQLRITVAGQTFDVTVETVGGCAPVAGAPAPAPVAAPVVAPAPVAAPLPWLLLLLPLLPVPAPPSPARWLPRWYLSMCSPALP